MKPANESGGYGIFIGTQATRRARPRPSATRSRPTPATGSPSPILELSTAPTLCDGELVAPPRRPAPVHPLRRPTLRHPGRAHPGRAPRGLARREQLPGWRQQGHLDPRPDDADRLRRVDVRARRPSQSQASGDRRTGRGRARPPTTATAPSELPAHAAVPRRRARLLDRPLPRAGRVHRPPHQGAHRAVPRPAPVGRRSAGRRCSRSPAAARRSTTATTDADRGRRGRPSSPPTRATTGRSWPRSQQARENLRVTRGLIPPAHVGGRQRAAASGSTRARPPSRAPAARASCGPTRSSAAARP